MPSAGESRSRVLVALAVTAAVITNACGGGGGSAAPAASPAPAPVTAPAISVQPSSQVADAGSSVTFSVSSPNAAAYQWQRSTDAGTTWTDVPGAASPTLPLPAAALIHSGTHYRVVLGNSAGTITSDAAGLVVRPFLRLLAGVLGGPGYLDGQGTAARFNFTRGSDVDASGDLLVADSENHLIRRISSAGRVTTFAGRPGLPGRVDGPTDSATIGFVRDIAIDGAGTVWFVDQSTCYLRKIANGVVTSVARLVLGAGSCELETSGSDSYDPAELAIGPGGDIFVSDRLRNVVLRVTAPGVVSVFAGSPSSLPGAVDGPRLDARFFLPRGLAFDSAGNLYVADSGNGVIRRINAAGDVSTVAGSSLDRRHLDGVGTGARLSRPTGLALLGNRWLGITDILSHTVRVLDLSTLALTTIAGSPGVSGSADGSGAAALFRTPFGISASTAGDFLVSDSSNSTVRRVSLTGAVTTFAGQSLPSGHSDGTGGAARLSSAHKVVADAAGNVFAVDAVSATIRKITPSGVVSTFAGSPGEFGLVDGQGAAARFRFPSGIAIDAAGNLIVADAENEVIRRVTPAGMVTTIAGSSFAGHLDGPALMAEFRSPIDVSVDPDGNIFVADLGNCAIRKVTPAGLVSTFAGLGGSFCMTVDGPAGTSRMSRVQVIAAVGVDDVLFAEVVALNPTRIRRARGDGSIATFAGSEAVGAADGQGTTASFASISQMARDRAGNVYVADSLNNAIRLLRPDGRVTTFLGAQSPVNTVPGALPTLRSPAGIAVLPNDAIAVSSEAAVLID